MMLSHKLGTLANQREASPRSEGRLSEKKKHADFSRGAEAFPGAHIWKRFLTQVFLQGTQPDKLLCYSKGSQSHGPALKATALCPHSHKTSGTVTLLSTVSSATPLHHGMEVAPPIATWKTQATASVEQRNTTYINITANQFSTFKNP